MKKLYILLTALLATVSLSAQTAVLDSLKLKLSSAKNDSERVRLLNAISSEYVENDPAQMMDFAQKALKLAQGKNIRQAEAESWVNIGNANIMMSKYGDAFKSFASAQAIFEQLVQKDATPELKNGLARTYGSIGVVCSEQNNYAKALEYYFKALKIYRETKQESIVARAYNNIGIVYKALKEYDKALEYFNKALAVQQKIKDPTSAVTITNIGNIYLLQNKNAQALASYTDAENKLSASGNKRGLG